MSSQESFNILVFGKTGAGKSTLINSLTNDNPHLPEGHEYESCTEHVQSASTVYKGREIVFYDTPGFDDSKIAPELYLLKLIESLGVIYEKYEKKPHIHGVLWIQPIHERRMTGTDVLNLDTFQDIIGSDGFRNLVFVTNFWRQPLPQYQLDHEQSLIHNQKYFAKAISAGARAGPAYRIFEGMDRASVQQALLGAFLNNPPIVAQSQKEFVDDEKPASETTAGRTQSRISNEKIKERDAQIAALKDSLKDQAKLAQAVKDLQEANDRARQDMETMKTTYADSLERMSSQTPNLLVPLIGGLLAGFLRR
ncbi:unnamed protein product [Rhizoctonia solani]|uniref:G domain-containing protein n=1 Tax=Rhizoctonia solani TaxID=456999 RepID=A0A8H3A3B6_9AGAM|nr:unnamed protein product [Rhizoctonia solani]